MRMGPSVSTGGQGYKMKWDPGIRQERDRLGVVGVSECKVSGVKGKRTRRSLRLKGTLQGKPCDFLIDSGATGDFISVAFIERYHLDSGCKPLTSPLTVEMADGGVYTSSRAITDMVIVSEDKEFNCRRDLLVLPLSGYDAILGMPWLEDVNPDIDWEAHTIQPRLRRDVVKNESNSVKLEPRTESDKARLEESLIGADSDVVGLVNRYADLFREDLPKGLPMSRPIEHSIKLVDCAGPVYLKQYRLSAKDQAEVDRQVQENLLAGKVHMTGCGEINSHLDEHVLLTSICDS